MRKLTGRQAEILRFINQFIKENGYSPSVEEIRKFFGFKSPNAVTCHLNSLRNKGFISRESSKARAIKMRFFNPGIPVIGKIAAGEPVITEDFQEDFLFSSDEMRDTFALKVKGDSMQQANIFDGDYVIVKKDIEVKNGDIVAAIIGEEATVKYFKKVKGKIFLVPANPSYSPVEIKENFILGKVVGIFRRISR